MIVRNLHTARAWPGFSLIEVMAVLSTVAVLAAALLPLLAPAADVQQRRGAAQLLMNRFEYARMAALETGQTVYVGFGHTEETRPELRRAALVIFRDTTEEERTASGLSYKVLKKWTPLPGSLVFAPVPRSPAGPDGAAGSFPGLNALMGEGAFAETFSFLSFTRTGAIGEPPGNALRLVLSDSSQWGIPLRPLGTITLSRATGRAHWTDPAPDRY